MIRAKHIYKKLTTNT